MAEGYTENPSNMADITQYIITDKNSFVRKIILAEKCFFYDACAFRNHAGLKNPEGLFEFIKRKNGIVIITRTVIMELASASKSLNTEYVQYFIKMYGAGLEVLVIYEEDIFSVLNQYYTVNAEINKKLDIAVRASKSTTGTISSVLKSNRQLREEIMADYSTDSMLFMSFFAAVRANKKPGDNLGEEMIAICIHMLANILEPYDYKYIVITEDKGAVRLINKIRKNIWEHLGRKAATVVTTAALSQKLYQEKIITTKSQIEEMIAVGTRDDVVKIVASEEYDLEPQEITLSCSDLAERIVTPNAICIYY